MIDTNEWKEFRFESIFDVRRGDRIVKDVDFIVEKTDEYAYPVITAKTTENGVDGYYTKYNCEGNCLVACGEASGMFTTYQTERCWCMDTVRIITLKNGQRFTANSALFLATLLTKETYRYSYGRKAKPDNMNTLMLKLPATPSGEPDWQYMEDFMRGGHCEPIKTSVKSSHLPLETEKWGEFRVGNIFDVTIAKSTDFGNADEGNIRFVGRSNENNGVQGFVDVPSEKIVGANCISVAMVGTNVALWQDEIFAASQNIAVLRNQSLNVHSGLFVCSVLNMDMRYKYSYGRTVSKEKLSDTTLLLPIQNDGAPDWQWMENYMRSLPYSDRIK